MRKMIPMTEKEKIEEQVLGYIAENIKPWAWTDEAKERIELLKKNKETEDKPNPPEPDDKPEDQDGGPTDETTEEDESEERE